MKHFITIISILTATLAAEPVKLEMFQEKLAGHGTWLTDASYGKAWQPHAAKTSSWRPYTRGQWVSTNHGWAWNSNEAFGDITYHYGRWALTPNTGWIWVPGAHWAPSWVSWRFGSNFVGWAPLPPKSLDFPNYSWGSNVDSLLSIKPEHYTFLQARDFSNFSESSIVSVANNPLYIHLTSNVTKIDASTSNITSGGPKPEDINQILEVDLPIYQLDKTQSQATSKLVTSLPKYVEPAPMVAETPEPRELAELKQLSELKKELASLRERQEQPVRETRITIYDAPPIIYTGSYCLPQTRSVRSSRTLHPYMSNGFIRPSTICRPSYYRQYNHQPYRSPCQPRYPTVRIIR